VVFGAGAVNPQNSLRSFADISADALEAVLLTGFAPCDPFLEQMQEDIRHARFSETDPEKIKVLQAQCALIGHNFRGFHQPSGDAIQWNCCMFCGVSE
jgi:hypothetical protein